MSKIFETMEKLGYEQVIFFHDKTTGLKGITTIHNTTLGPALGGTRMWKYKSEEEVLTDSMRLARGMTLKNAAAGLNAGGAKTAIWADAKKDKSEAFWRAYGRYVESLNGRFVTAEDVNTNLQDMHFINMETEHVVGLEGIGGNPSPITAWGCYRGIQASLMEKFGHKEVKGHTFAIQGVGNVGYALLEILKEKGAKKIYYTDINPDNIARVRKNHTLAQYVDGKKYWSLDVDVLAPCALGAVLNPTTIKQIKAPIVAGSANNQLADEDRDADLLKKKGILYAPDFVCNGGGVINCYHELIHPYSREATMRDVDMIYGRMLEIFKIAKARKINTQKAANLYAEKRIKEIGDVRKNFVTTKSSTALK